MLKTIDLFSGVGGITLALKGIAHPVAYCDVDPVARECIEFNIRRRRLPKAPIHPDIKTFTKVPKADMVVGGFPCVGFSGRGKLEGFEHEGSGLFYEILRIVDGSKARAVFLENVPGVMRESASIIHELSVKRKFELRWEFDSSHDIGAPHKRVRWFCLCVKKGSKLETTVTTTKAGGYAPYDWSGKGPSRTCSRSTDRDGCIRSMKRWGLMGNSVVPDAVRLAFLRLFSGGAVPDLHTAGRLRYSNDLASGPESTGAASRIGIFCVESGKKSVRKVRAATDVAKNGKELSIVLDPKTRAPPKKASPNQVHPSMTAPVRLGIWATPAHSQAHSQRVMTLRSIQSLPTQIRFERGTKNREGVLAPMFTEWMMGYPLGFTDARGDKC